MEQLFHVCSQTTCDQHELYCDASCRLLPYEVTLMEKKVLHTSSALQETPSLMECSVLCQKHAGDSEICHIPPLEGAC